MADSGPQISFSRNRLSQLWQAPLFILSIALFLFAAYLLVRPGPGLTIDQKIEVARNYLKQDRPDSALEQLQKLLELEKLDKAHEADIHILAAEALEDDQKRVSQSIPTQYQRVIEQTRIGLAEGARGDVQVYRRLAQSYAALGQGPEAARNFDLAINLDKAHALPLWRKLIELQLSDRAAGNAEASLDQYLQFPELTDSERAWALSQKAKLLIDNGEYFEARKLLVDALRLTQDPVSQGQYNYHLGYAAYKEGEFEQAERILRLSRDQLRVTHPLDADAAYLLGKIYRHRGDAPTANSFFQEVLTSHPDATVAPLSLLERGLCRLMLGQIDPGMSDLHEIVATVQSRPSRAIYKDDVIRGLRQASEVLGAQEQYKAALEAMGYEQSLDPSPKADFFARLALLYDKRGDQIERSIFDASAADQIRHGQQVRELRNHAADAYLAYSRALTLVDDQGYAAAMWRAIDLFDRAGNIQSVIATLELFTTERPTDRLAPDALLRLGRAYQAAGRFDKAIRAFQENELRFPKSLAASKSAVPLAQAYMAKGPEAFTNAERVLLNVLNGDVVDPSAEEFRQSLFELAQLYYRTGRFEEAIVRLEELTKRYPKEEHLPQLTFLMADSYRKSASLLDTRLATADASSVPGPGSDVAEAVAAKRDRLTRARALYDKSVDLYRVNPPTTDVDKLYLKLAHFYRADCVYDLGNYEEAIRLYDTAAFRYQEDPSSLAAYVQIVNAYCALGRPAEAKTANERAKWILKHMPPEAFQDGSFAMPREYWDKWLEWSSKSGMW